ncbi:hypothetical protein QO012_002590 [Methylobacterium aerolatum]|uniref:Uncharacterized protein n=1 Tax=Methylobacterium aerolatum TaxID=418708 RepID=A0ABU0I0G0_9HYPH|nr:hypothetical protein [Methylobacterium aerolatum]GJD35756.1 hypothetical protein FMGBMHLM_2668 [Methylobacterium aerolatum]
MRVVSASCNDFRQPLRLDQHAVDPVAHPHVGLLGLEVDVGGRRVRRPCARGGRRAAGSARLARHVLQTGEVVIHRAVLLRRRVAVDRPVQALEMVRTHEATGDGPVGQVRERLGDLAIEGIDHRHGQLPRRRRRRGPPPEGPPLASQPFASPPLGAPPRPSPGRSRGRAPGPGPSHRRAGRSRRGRHDPLKDGRGFLGRAGLDPVHEELPLPVGGEGPQLGQPDAGAVERGGPRADHEHGAQRLVGHTANKSPENNDHNKIMISLTTIQIVQQSSIGVVPVRPPEDNP